VLAIEKLDSLRFAGAASHGYVTECRRNTSNEIAHQTDGMNIHALSFNKPLNIRFMTVVRYVCEE